jgi:hypothetical protein
VNTAEEPARPFWRQGDMSRVENKRFGERGRNRTYNLLFFYQQLKTNGFNDFPIVHLGRNGQFEARLLRNLLRNSGQPSRRCSIENRLLRLTFYWGIFPNLTHKGRNGRVLLKGLKRHLHILSNRAA